MAGTRLIKKASDDTKLPLAGGTMTDAIDMDDNYLENVGRLYLGGAYADDLIDDDTFGDADARNIATSESIKAYVDAEHYHAYNGGSYWGTSSLRYIPFSGSTSEQTSRAYNRDYISQIIMPYDGNVMKLYLYNDHQSVSDPGSTDVTVWKNGSSGDSDTQALGYRTAVLFSLDENFSAGDRIQIAIDPSGTIRYLTHNLLVKFDA